MKIYIAFMAPVPACTTQSMLKKLIGKNSGHLYPRFLLFMVNQLHMGQFLQDKNSAPNVPKLIVKMAFL